MSQHADAVVANDISSRPTRPTGTCATSSKKRLTDLNVNPAFSMADFKAVPKEWRERIPEYVKDAVAQPVHVGKLNSSSPTAGTIIDNDLRADNRCQYFPRGN
ncbi:MAG: hypothetical protein U5N21_16715 [Rhodococcus sp. (in: high G+C Gram-positive bacteria)]|nr:hypothetical protein [Rhodococcus sp. (in: high G+C Gram-positive bacteria)]